MDFDPRDQDSREDQRFDTERSRGGRGASAEHNGEHHWRSPHGHSEGLHQNSRELGRGHGDSRDSNHSGQDSRDDARWSERERSYDPLLTRVACPFGAFGRTSITSGMSGDRSASVAVRFQDGHRDIERRQVLLVPEFSINGHERIEAGGNCGA